MYSKHWFGSYLFLSIKWYTPAVNLIQMCSLVCVLSMDESLIVLGFIWEPLSSAHSAVIAYVGSLPLSAPHTPTDSARTRGPLTGARDWRLDQNPANSMTSKKRPPNTQRSHICKKSGAIRVLRGTKKRKAERRIKCWLLKIRLLQKMLISDLTLVKNEQTNHYHSSVCDNINDINGHIYYTISYFIDMLFH